MIDRLRPPGSAAIRVDADLVWNFDQGSATITGHGNRITVTADRPEQLWRQVTSADLPAGLGRVNGPRAVGRLADRVQQLGLEVVVTGPDGPVLRLGGPATPGLRQAVARAATGSAQVHPGNLRVLAPLAGQMLPHRGPWWIAGGAALGAAALGGLAAGLVRRSRR